jgi:hypothetical protein
MPAPAAAFLVRGFRAMTRTRSREGGGAGQGRLMQLSGDCLGTRTIAKSRVPIGMKLTNSPPEVVLADRSAEPALPPPNISRKPAGNLIQRDAG